MLHRSRLNLAIMLLFVLSLSAACTSTPAPPQVAAPEPPESVEKAPPALLSSDEREALFEDLWQYVNQHYLFFERRTVNWAEVRTKYQTALRQAPHDDAVRDILRQALAEVQDGHLYLKTEDNQWTDPLVFVQPDGENLVLALVEPGSDAERQGLKPGMLLLEIDGVPAAEAWRRSTAGTSSSTPHRQRWAGARDVLKGSEGSTVRVVAGFPGAEPIRAILKRTVKATPFIPEYEEKTLPGGYLYVGITTMTEKHPLEKAWDAFKWAQRHNPPGLIIDVRYNKGGRDPFGFGQYLMTKPTVIGYTLDHTTGKKEQAWAYPPLKVYYGPILVLTNPGCASACDVFATFMEQTGRAQLVGEPPAGMALSTEYHWLLFGHRIAIPFGMEVLGPEGEPVEGHPAHVAYPVVPTAADWAAGRDPVLEKALELLASGKL
ncbi:MAG TPA: S41 family peptidase [Candidatus Sulfotelmatobacter sp.]|nr:S41 family peptidase [Candidatus Sulfotelmatobacter sp.]HWI62065.1 S41 family peptidase [Symbiobacteriaceae bacterium]